MSRAFVVGVGMTKVFKSKQLPKTTPNNLLFSSTNLERQEITQNLQKRPFFQPFKTAASRTIRSKGSRLAMFTVSILYFLFVNYELLCNR